MTTSALTMLAILVLGAQHAAQASGKDQGELVFVSTRSGNEEIWMMDASGEGLRQISDSGRSSQGDYAPDWSPDGSRIALTTYRYGGWKIAVMDSRGKGIRRLTDNERAVYEDFPRWSPDGSKLAYIRYRSSPGIYILDLDGQQRRITDNRKDSYQEQTIGPAWTPDGAALLYASKASGNFNIVRQDLSSGEVVELIAHPADDLAPDVSPDGTKLLFYSNREGSFDVWTANIDGTNVRRLTREADNSRAYKPQETSYVYNAAWSPDGEQIAYVALVGEQAEIFVISSDDSNRRRLTDDRGEDLFPRWRSKQPL